jgi:hypothetical protein
MCSCLSSSSSCALSWAERAGWLIALVAASYGVHWATLSLAPSHGAIADWAASRPTVATHSLLPTHFTFSWAFSPD